MADDPALFPADEAARIEAVRRVRDIPPVERLLMQERLLVVDDPGELG